MTRPAERRSGRRRAEQPEKTFAHYIGLGLSAATLLLVIALAIIVIVVPRVTGSTALTVLTSSMEPGLPPGTLIVVKPVDIDEIAVGDVVTYQLRSGESTLVTHRVIGISSTTTGDRRFELQGDNNSTPDGPIVAEQVMGRVWYAVPLIGHVNTAVSGENRSWIVAGGAVLLFAYAGYTLAAGIRSAIHKKRNSEQLPELVSGP